MVIRASERGEIMHYNVPDKAKRLPFANILSLVIMSADKLAYRVTKLYTYSFRLWRNCYNVIELRDVVGHVAIRLSIDDFLYVL